MKLKYKTVDTRTLAGLEKAERLFANGWIIGSVGLDTIQFYKRKEVNHVHNKTI